MPKKQFRREKETPNADMWHTLRIGFVMALLIWLGVGVASTVIH